jgi:MFS family permease
VALAVTITLFLTTLTYMENDDAENKSAAGNDNLILIIGLLGSAVVSLILFIVAEKKATSPIVDLKLIVNKTIFPILIMFLLLGFTMFMIYQTVPILVTAPIPLGFGGSAITSFILLPFTLVFLVLCPTVGIMVGKFGNIKLFIAGSMISAVGYFIFLFHSTELEVSVSLAIVSTGLALLNTIGMNIVMLSTPKQFGGITIGMVQVLMFIGMSIGPVVGGMYMQRYQESSVVDAISTSFPSPVAYDLIFLTALIVSLSFVELAIILKRENRSSIADPIRNQ